METLTLWLAVALAAWVLLVLPVGIVVGRAIGRGAAVVEHRVEDPFAADAR